MIEPSKSTTQKIPLEDSRLPGNEISDIRWLEEQFGVVWDSHAVEFVQYDTLRNVFQMCTTVSGRGPDMEEFKYRSRDCLGDFENPNLIEWTLNEELQLDIDYLRKLSEYPPDKLTDEEYVRIYGLPSGMSLLGGVLVYGIDQNLDWS